MSEEPLGSHGLPPWDVLCIHYACDPQRTDVLMRASHIIGDGQLFMKLIKQIMQPLDAAARTDFHASITHARAGTPGVGRRSRQGGEKSSGGSTSSSGGRSSDGGGFSSGSGSSSSCGRVSDGSSYGADGKQRQQQRSSSSLPQQQLKQRQLQQRPQEEALLNNSQQQRKKQGGLKRWWQLFVG